VEDSMRRSTLACLFIGASVAVLATFYCRRGSLRRHPHHRCKRPAPVRQLRLVSTSNGFRQVDLFLMGPSGTRTLLTVQVHLSIFAARP
jgi:hypothetical protein